MTGANKALQQYSEAQHKGDVGKLISLQGALRFNGGGEAGGRGGRRTCRDGDRGRPEGQRRPAERCTVCSKTFRAHQPLYLLGEPVPPQGTAEKRPGACCRHPQQLSQPPELLLGVQPALPHPAPPPPPLRTTSRPRERWSRRLRRSLAPWTPSCPSSALPPLACRCGGPAARCAAALLAPQPQHRAAPHSRRALVCRSEHVQTLTLTAKPRPAGLGVGVAGVRPASQESGAAHHAQPGPAGAVYWLGAAAGHRRLGARMWGF